MRDAAGGHRARQPLAQPIDRVADALGFDLMDEAGYRQAAQALLKFGYKLPAPLRLLARNPAW